MIQAKRLPYRDAWSLCEKSRRSGVKRLKVAVLMSTYNGGQYIEEQINSILNQAGDFQLDLIVRDDGSSDDTLDIIRRYPNVHWYCGENLGPAGSFLDLITHTTGYDFYAFADQDDFWMPDKISVAISAIQDKNIPALYFCNADLVDSTLHTYGRNVYRSTPKFDFKTLLCAGGLLGCTMVFNHKLAQVIQNQLPPSRIVMHDFFVASLCLAIGGEIVYDHEPHMKYRQHGNNVVGVSRGRIQTLRDRLKMVITTTEIGIDDNAAALRRYVPANDEIMGWIDRVYLYKKSVFSRMTLAFSVQTHYTNLNQAVTNRLRILLGNQ